MITTVKDRNKDHAGAVFEDFLSWLIKSVEKCTNKLMLYIKIELANRLNPC